MSSDKRRRARVQGGWASGSRSSLKPAAKRNQRNYDEYDTAKPGIDSSELSKENSNGPKSPKVLNPSSAVPAWTGKIVDVPPKHEFVYEQPEQAVRLPPEVRWIKEPGVYDISMSEKGVSRLRLFYSFLSREESKTIFQTLFSELPWRLKVNTRNGVSYKEPRMTAWFGDLPYRYSGVIQEANTNWHPCLRQLQTRLEENTGLRFNSVLCNLYRDCHDSVDWHTDNEVSLGDQPTIASISLGETRFFEMRKFPPPEEKGDFTYSEHIKIGLTSGSLLIMEGASQDDWQHRVPKEYHDKNPRINLTFRVIYET